MSKSTAPGDSEQFVEETKNANESISFSTLKTTASGFSSVLGGKLVLLVDIDSLTPSIKKQLLSTPQNHPDLCKCSLENKVWPQRHFDKSNNSFEQGWTNTIKLLSSLGSEHLSAYNALLNHTGQYDVSEDIWIKLKTAIASAELQDSLERISQLKLDKDKSKAFSHIFFDPIPDVQQNIEVSKIERQLQDLETQVQLQIDDRPSVLALMKSNAGLMPLLREVVTTIEGDYRNCLFNVSVDELDPSQLFVKIFRDEYPKGFGRYLREYRKQLVQNITSHDDARVFIYTGFGPKPI